MRIQKNSKKRKILKGIKFILFVTMLILSYFVSDRVVDFLLTIEVITLKRALNLILAVILMFMAMYKKEINEEG